MSEKRWSSVEIARIAAPICIVAIGFGGFSLMSSLKQKPARADDSHSSRLMVEVVPVVLYDQPVKIKLSGLVVPYREVLVPVEVSGRVSGKADICRAGRYVTAGTELLTIDRQDYELAQQEASSALEELRSDISSTRKLLGISRQQLEIEQREFQREQKLRGVVADADLDQSKRELLIAENSVVTLETQIESLASRERRLNAALSKADLDLERTTIKAPISGVVVSEQVENDSFVQRGATLLVIEDTSKAEVTCNLRKQDLQWLWLSQTTDLADDDGNDANDNDANDNDANDSDANDNDAESNDDPADFYEIPKADARIFFELAGTQYMWSGKLARYDGIGLDTQTRTIPCRILVENPRQVAVAEPGKSNARTGPPALLRGMYVSVEIDAQPQVPLFKMPKSAVRPGKNVWLVRHGWFFDKLVKQPVTLVETSEEDIIVNARADQIFRDDRIVVSPLSYPQEGTPVRIQGDEPSRVDERGAAEGKDGTAEPEATKGNLE